MSSSMDFLGATPELHYSQKPGESHITKYKYSLGRIQLEVELDGVNWGYELEVDGAFKHIGDTSFSSAYAAKRSATRRLRRVWQAVYGLDLSSLSDE